MITNVRGFSNRSPTPNSRPSSSADSTSGQLTAPQFHVSVSGLKGREKLVRPAKIANKNWASKIIVNKKCVLLYYPCFIIPQLSQPNYCVSAGEMADLRNFNPGVDKDNYTITFPQHPCVILNALEVLGFRWHCWACFCAFQLQFWDCFCSWKKRLNVSSSTSLDQLTSNHTFMKKCRIWTQFSKNVQFRIYSRKM